MNLQNLKWTKNVRRSIEPKWAYDLYGVKNLFKLAWKDNEINASKPQREDLILLRQHGYVTHLVEVLDYKPEREQGKDDFDIYRIVEVLWIIDDWENPPYSAKANEVFGYPIKLRGGNVMRLENMRLFQQHWQNQGGLTAFQKHVWTKLNNQQKAGN